VIGREVKQILTQGTLVDEAFINDPHSLYLLAIKEIVRTNRDSFGPPVPHYGVCFVDTSTGEFHLGEFIDDIERTQFETLILQIKPSEILYEKVIILFFVIFYLYLKKTNILNLGNVYNSELKYHKTKRDMSDNQRAQGEGVLDSQSSDRRVAVGGLLC